MSASVPPALQPRSLARRLLPLILVVALAGTAYLVVGESGISLDALVRHRAAIDTFVSEHHVLAVLAYTVLYVGAVALSLPGATFLTVAGGFLFGIVIGAAAAVIGATLGATLIFLVARTALGEPLLRLAGPRANQLAKEFRDDAFSYLLFLRLLPSFPFFLVNRVPAFSGVRLARFFTPPPLGVIPGALVCTLGGMGLDARIAAQQSSYHQCIASGGSGCRIAFDTMDVLTPQLIAALAALGLLSLMPVVLKHWRALSRAAMSC